MWQYSVCPRSSGNYIEDGDIQKINIAEQNCRDCSNAIEREPNRANLYLDRSRFQQGLKKYDLAIQDLSIAMQLDPERSYFYLYLRHLLHLYMGNLEKALEDIRQAVDTGPDGSDYFRCLAYVYQQLGQIDNAVTALTNGISRDPYSHLSYLRRAAFYEGIGHLEEALCDATEAVRIKPRNWIIYRDRVSIYIKLGQFENALRDCNTCIEAEPKEWTHYRVRSEVYAAMGDSNAAGCDYTESMNLNSFINR